MNTQIKNHYSGIIFSIILILFGALLIAANTGLIPPGFNKIIISWQMLMIIIGVCSVFKRRGLHFHGLLFICLGIFFIIPRVAKIFPSVFGNIDTNFIKIYWPVLLIVSGIIFILHILCKPSPPSCHHRSHKCYSHFYGNNSRFHNEENYYQAGDFSKTSIFSNGRYIVIDTEFTGGTLNSVFGGIELDLRKAYLPEGDTILNIEAVFSGITIFVPDSWLLDVKVESMLGGIDDERRITETVDTSRKLILRGSVTFGGVEIKN
ncbi:MAG: cell wall-active antibiotics response protein [Prevotellaceae bacterium]|jgi:predicted membrane protein|nr:cell wall-active antibiotics response protein [Prevotellaceae bacterium]